jgi:hypothetical protein
MSDTVKEYINFIVAMTPEEAQAFAEAHPTRPAPRKQAKYNGEYQKGRRERNKATAEANAAAAKQLAELIAANPELAELVGK